MNTRLTINLNDFAKARKFSNEASKFISEIDVIKGRYVIDVVMKKPRQLCLMKVISIPHGQRLAGVGDAERVLIPQGIQFFLQLFSDFDCLIVHNVLLS